MDAHFERRMTDSDSLLWYIEQDPLLRTTITAVAVLDRAPDTERLRARIDRASRLIPRLRQKVVAPRLRIGPPTWVVDPRFDLSYHVRRVDAPSPHDLRAVLDYASPIAADDFDRERPLWEFTIVEGLEGGRSALIQKLHHALTDGVGGMHLMALLVDLERDAPELGDMPQSPEAESPGQLRLLEEAITNDVRVGVTAAQTGLRQLPGAVRNVVFRPGRTVNDSTRMAGSVAKLLAPISEPLSPIMRDRGLMRRFSSFDVPVDALKKVAHEVDGTLNDAFLAGVAMGFDHYHRRHGVEVDGLRVTMPINIREEGDPIGNNRFTPARFEMPVRFDDAHDAMRSLGALARSWQQEPSLAYTNVLAGILNRLPSGVTTQVFGSMLKAIDFVATNVPGAPMPVYMAGARVEREYAFAPTSGASVAIALLSMADTAGIGVNTDTTAVDDPQALVESLRDGFEQVVGTETTTLE